MKFSIFWRLNKPWILIGLGIVIGSPEWSLAVFIGSRGVSEVSSQSPSENWVEYPISLTGYPLVSVSNCESDFQGQLSRCRFPSIVYKKDGPFPPLPFETQIRIVATPYCQGQIGEVVGGLQCRLTQSTALKSHRKEYLNFGRTQRQIFSHPRGLPFEAIEIKLIHPLVFESAIFPQGCQVYLEWEPNRISLKTTTEAEDYFQERFQSLENLMDLKQLFLALQTTREKLGEKITFLETAWKAAVSVDSTRGVELRWKQFHEFINQFEKQMGTYQEVQGSQEIQHFIQTLRLFGKVLRRQKATLDLEPGGLDEEKQGVEAQQNQKLFLGLDQLCGPHYLNRIENQIDQQKCEALFAQQALLEHFKGQFYPNLLQDLKDIAFDEISGPQGILNLWNYELQQGSSQPFNPLPQEVHQNESLE